MGQTAAPPIASVVPPYEEQRLAAVRRYAILDTPPDGAFDRITALAARLLRTPIATISIVDRDRIWFKSRHGLDAEQIGRDPGLCASAILQDEPWLVVDAAQDPRTLENPLVRGDLGLRFYVGIPLRTHDGFNLGTLNIIDRAPRQASQEEIRTLSDLAAVVVDELELRLSALREEQRLDRVRADFLATAAHELRTLRAALARAAVALVSREAPGGARTEVLAEVETYAGRLEDTVEQASAELGSEAGRIRIVRERFDPLWAANRALDAVRPGLPANVSLVLLPEDGLPPLEADPRLVTQILGYLVDNAIRYSLESGRIELRVSGTARGVRFTVTDEGIGIPADERELVFEKFRRAEPAVGLGIAGTGLGLYVARELAQELGGRITLDDAPGQGSSFTLELPSG